MKIITVSREFGSGGREIAKRLSDVLGIAYYDSEIITEIAKKADLDENYVAHSLEKGIQPTFQIHFACAFSHVPGTTASLRTKRSKRKSSRLTRAELRATT